MSVTVDVVVIILSILALWKGADFLVEAAARIAVRFGISQLVIGLTIVAFGTSAPELVVSVLAAARSQADISVGNIVGSNIFNLGFILGTVALLRTIKTSSPLVYRDGLVLIAISGLLLFFMRDLQLERWEAGVMLAGLLLYVGFLIFKKQEDAAEELPEGEFNKWDILRLLGGLCAVVVGGHFFVESASDIARLLGMSEWVIGVTIVAAGTSAPELATSLVAAIRGRHAISAGNLIGSDIFNILGVLGVAGVVAPMSVHPGAMSSLYMLGGLMVVVVLMMRTGWKISRLEGALLILVSLLRWILDFS
ncbi:MAG: calcium/sodium antiporter [Ignavibacteriae bacterium]|nr:calcium/sodium antiporter [Ignavibacteriota bacterium]MCB9217515.1 calcium/sodium antiporter [Ignavibacteria bacterium]